MDFIALTVACLAGYCLGAISFTRIIVKRVAPQEDLSRASIPIQGVDQPLRMTSVSANTAGLILGPKVGGMIGILDLLKVLLPTLSIRLLYPEQPYYLATAVMGIVGHNWPAYYRFKGGRGISAIFGGLLAIDWLGAIIVSLVGFTTAMVILRDFAFIFPISLILIIPWLWFTTQDPVFVLYGLAANILFGIAIIPEIKEVMRSRREKHGAGSMEEMMRTNPMGRSMLAIADRLKKILRG
jgi:glycerol-3-phosphate acyltransferase PlsY